MNTEFEFVRVSIKSSCLTLQEVVQAAAQHGRAIVPIKGGCMEGRDIMDGGWVAVDFAHYPRPGHTEGDKYISGDPCMCYAQFPSREDEPPHPPSVMCKQYNGVWLGHMVGTRYKQRVNCKFRMNCGFPAIAILGVVFASWGPDGALLWETDPEAYPTELPTQVTVKSDNIDLSGALVRSGGHRHDF